MKKNLFFFLSFILCTQLAAQVILPAFEALNRSINKNDDYILVQDYDMVWNNSQSIWEHTRNTTYSYNEFFNPVEKFEKWTDGRGPYGKTDCDYDASQNLDEERIYKYTDSAWVNDVKNQYNYDENNNRIQKVRQSWNGENFVNEIKSTYAYDANNKKIYQMMYYWDEGAWVESQKFDYQYDEYGNLYKVMSKAWIENEWVNRTKSIFTFDTNNNLIMVLGSNWDLEESNWPHPHQRQLYTYQDNNRIIFTIEQWDEDYEFWYNEYKTTYYYQPVGYETNENTHTNINKSIEDFQTTEDDIVIDPGRDDQVLTGVEVLLDSILHTSDGDLEFTLSHNGISETLIYYAGGEGDNFINTKLSDRGVDSVSNGVAPFLGIYQAESPLSSFLTTDPEGTWTLSIYDGVSGNTGTLIAWGLNFIYAENSGVEDVLAESLTFNLFPNPTKSTVNIQLAEGCQHSAFIEIYDIDGKLILKKGISLGTTSIGLDLSHLASGVYSCRVISGTSSSTKKLIIKK